MHLQQLAQLAPPPGCLEATSNLKQLKMMLLLLVSVFPKIHTLKVAHVMTLRGEDFRK